MNIQEIALDVTKRTAIAPVVRIGQGDKNGTTLRVKMYDDGAALQLSNYTVRFTMLLPDGKSYYSVNGTKSANVATFAINETYAGRIAGTTDTAYVEVLSGSAVICSTNRFTVVVLKSAQEGAEPSAAYSNGIIEATERAEAAAEAAEGVVLDAVPLMSANVRGGAKLGGGLSIVDGALQAEAAADPISTATIDSVVADNSPTGGDVLQTTGLSYLWSKLKSAFAALSHQHVAGDIVSGAVAIANGGTGSDSAAGALANLGAASATDLDTAEASITALQEAVGTVDVDTDGDLQAQIDALGDSVDQLPYAIYENTLTGATVNGGDDWIQLGGQRSNGISVYLYANISNGRLSIIKVASDGTRTTKSITFA